MAQTSNNSVFAALCAQREQMDGKRLLTAEGTLWQFAGGLGRAVAVEYSEQRPQAGFEEQSTQGLQLNRFAGQLPTITQYLFSTATRWQIQDSDLPQLTFGLRLPQLVHAAAMSPCIRNLLLLFPLHSEFLDAPRAPP